MCLAWLHRKGSLHPSEWKRKEELKGILSERVLCSSRYSSVIHASFRGDCLLPHLFLILFKD